MCGTGNAQSIYVNIRIKNCYRNVIFCNSVISNWVFISDHIFFIFDYKKVSLIFLLEQRPCIIPVTTNRVIQGMFYVAHIKVYGIQSSKRHNKTTTLFQILNFQIKFKSLLYVLKYVIFNYWNLLALCGKNVCSHLTFSLRHIASIMEYKMRTQTFSRFCKISGILYRCWQLHLFLVL